MKKQKVQVPPRAQSTIEYLVIIAIIIVLSLVVTTIVLNTTSSQDVSKNSDDIASKIGSGSISISEAYTDPDGDSLITLQNISSDTITITKISTGNQDSFFSNPVIQGNTETISLSDINTDCPCTNGTTTSCTYTITYTQNGVTKTSTITKTTKCTNNTTPVGNTIGGGTGTLADPWIINSCTELQGMRNHLDGNYALSVDINCYNATQTTTGALYNSGAGFAPVGNDSNPFTGTLNGRGKSIHNLFINSNQVFVGLFAVIATNSKIQKLGLNEALFYCTSTNPSASCGGITGMISSSSLEENVVIENVFFKGSIFGSNQAGGLVGQDMHSGGKITLQNSYTNGSIYGNNTVGGIIGYNNNLLINNCYSTGVLDADNIGGGLVGYEGEEYPLVSNSFATIQVTVDDEVKGGIVGAVDANPLVDTVYWDKTATTQDECSYHGSAGCSFTEEDVEAYYGASGIPFATLNWSTDIWQANENNYPTLK